MVTTFVPNIFRNFHSVRSNLKAGCCTAAEKRLAGYGPTGGVVANYIQALSGNAPNFYHKCFQDNFVRGAAKFSLSAEMFNNYNLLYFFSTATTQILKISSPSIAKPA
jgi:hypothetical protein